MPNCLVQTGVQHGSRAGKDLVSWSRQPGKGRNISLQCCGPGGECFEGKALFLWDAQPGIAIYTQPCPSRSFQLNSSTQLCEINE